MLRIFFVSIALCALLFGCSTGEKQTDNSDHPLKEQKQALDKAKEADRLADEAAERQRKALEETR